MAGLDGETFASVSFIPYFGKGGKQKMTANVDYSAVLEDLESRKAQIDSAIEAVKSILASGGGSASGGGGGGVISPDKIPVGAFLRLSIVDATKRFLDMVKTKQGVPQIVAALERGGLPPSKPNTVYSVLRRREAGVGDIIRIGDEWALAEWYPNNPGLKKRTPTAKKKGKGKAKKKTPAKKKKAAAGSAASVKASKPAPEPKEAPDAVIPETTEAAAAETQTAE